MTSFWKQDWFAPVASAATSFLFPSLGDKIGGLVGLSGETANIAGNALVGAGIGALSNGGQGALTGALAGGLTRGLTGLTGYDGGLSGFMNSGSFAGGLGGTLGAGGIGSDAVASKAGALTQAGAAQAAATGGGGLLGGGMGDLVKLAPLALIGATLMGGGGGSRPSAAEQQSQQRSDAAYEATQQPLRTVEFKRTYKPYQGDYTKYGQVGAGGEHEFYDKNKLSHGGQVQGYADGGPVAPSPSGWQQPTWGALRSFGAPRWAGPSFDPGTQMQEMQRPAFQNLPNASAFQSAMDGWRGQMRDWAGGLQDAIRGGTFQNYGPPPMLEFTPAMMPTNAPGFSPPIMPDAPSLPTEAGIQPPAPAQQMPPMQGSSSSSSSSSSVSGAASNGGSWSGSSGTLPQQWRAPQIPRSPMQGGALTRFGGSAMRFASGGHVPTGRTDDVPAMLSDGEYVIDAETVALLGDGSSDAGAKKLDQMRAAVRRHKGRALARGKISPDAHDPVRYVGLN